MPGCWSVPLSKKKRKKKKEKETEKGSSFCQSSQHTAKPWQMLMYLLRAELWRQTLIGLARERGGDYWIRFEGDREWEMPGGKWRAHEREGWEKMETRTEKLLKGSHNRFISRGWIYSSSLPYRMNVQWKSWRRHGLMKKSFVPCYTLSPYKLPLAYYDLYTTVAKTWNLKCLHIQYIVG